MDGIITFRDSFVNTYRVRRTSQAVNNGQMAFSDNLRTLRKRRGLSQEALALACGWSGQSRVANYESSDLKSRQPKLDEVPIIAKALGVSVAELFGEVSAHAGLQSQLERPDPAILAQTQEFLETAYAFQGKRFEMARDADLFADAYEWLAEDERPVDQRNLVHFGQWMAARNQAAEGRDSEQSERTTGQVAGKNQRRAG